MSTNIAILCDNYGSYNAPWENDSNALMRFSGNNIGNFAFWNASNKIVAGTKITFSFNDKPDKFIGKVDLVLIPAANFLNENGDLIRVANFIEQLNVPCVMLGLGAQSEQTDYIPKLKDGTKKFLHEVAMRTPFIGVRGEFSKLVCEHYGVKNVEVLGCPSIFINPHKNLGRIIEQKWQSINKRIAVHASCIKGNARNIERRLFEFIDLFPGSSFIVQRPIELIKVLFNEQLSENDIVYLKKVANFLAPDLEYNQFIEKLKSHVYVPYSIDSWVFYLKHFSHAIGTRIHGSILSLSAEIPTICITHDTRTKELCDTLLVPSTSVTEYKNDQNSISSLFCNVKFDGKSFDDNRLRLAQRTQSLLLEAGFPIAKHLLNFFT